MKKKAIKFNKLVNDKMDIDDNVVGGGGGVAVIYIWLRVVRGFEIENSSNN